MDQTWLKSTILWIIILSVIILIFQCTQKNESNKPAPILMYERLFHCTAELDPKQHTQLIQLIKTSVHTEMTQKDLMKLMHECRQANPLKSREQYVSSIKNFK